MRFGHYAEDKGYPYIVESHCWHEVAPDSVAQFIGYDKNGKEIFEGDKVKFRDSIGYVVFHNGNFILDNNRDLNDLLSGVVFDGSLEIVGNGEEG